MEFPEAALFTEILATTPAVGIIAVTLLEFCKVLRRQWSLFLGNARDIGAGIEDPYILCGIALLEKNDIGLHALTVRGKGASRQTQDRVEAAILHKDLKDLARLVFKEAVVRQDHGGTASGLQDVHDMLDKVELLVARLDGKVVTLRGLICALGPEGRVCEDTIIKLPAIGFIDGIAEIDLRFQSVEEKVHEGKPPGAWYKVLAEVGRLPDPFEVLPVKGTLIQQPFIGAHEESAGAAGGIADGEFTTRSGVWFHDAHNGFDEDTRGKILTRPFLAFARRSFQETFKSRSFDVHIHGGPFFLVNHGDDPLQINGVIEARHRLGENIAEKALFLAELSQNVGIMVREVRTGAVLQAVPVAAVWNDDAFLIGHLQEEEVGELLDVVAVVDSVMAKGVAEAPEFVDDVGHELIYPSLSPFHKGRD